MREARRVRGASARQRRLRVARNLAPAGLTRRPPRNEATPGSQRGAGDLVGDSVHSRPTPCVRARPPCVRARTPCVRARTPCVRARTPLRPCPNAVRPRPNAVRPPPERYASTLEHAGLRSIRARHGATRRCLSPHGGAPRRSCNASRNTAARLAAAATPLATRRPPRRSCNASRHTAARLAAAATPPAARRRASPQLQRLSQHGGASRRSCNASRHTAARLAAAATPSAARRRASPQLQRLPPHRGASRRLAFAVHVATGEVVLGTSEAAIDEGGVV